jgi:hypothetical protein
MAAPESISVLGESLLAGGARQGEAKNAYKKQRRDAYKMAFATAGLKVLNKSLINKFNQFQTQEPVMAARVKQKQGYEDAQTIIGEYATATSNGRTAKEYYTEAMLPQARVIANEQAKANGIRPGVEYDLFLRNTTEKLAEEKAAKLQEAYDVAVTVESSEDFEKFAALRNTKPTSAFQMLTRKVGSLFTGRTQNDVDTEAMESIASSPMVKKAETATALRQAFNQTGNIRLAVNVAEAVEKGEVTNEPEKYKYERIPVNEITSGKLKQGVHVLQVFREDGTTPVFRADGVTPLLIEQAIGPTLDEQKRDALDQRGIKSLGKEKYTNAWGMEGEREIHIWVDGNDSPLTDEKGNAVEFKSVSGGANLQLPMSLAQAAASIDDTTKGMAVAVFDTVFSHQPDDTKQLFTEYNETTFGMEEGEVSGPLMDVVAATSRVKAQEWGFDPSQEPIAQALTSQVYLNRVKEATDDGGFWRGSFADPAKLSFTATPDSPEYLLAFGDLEGTPSEITFDEVMAGKVLGTLQTDFSRKGKDYQTNFLNILEEDIKWSDQNKQPSRFDFVRYQNEQGDSILSMLYESAGYVPVEKHPNFAESNKADVMDGRTSVLDGRYLVRDYQPIRE